MKERLTDTNEQSLERSFLSPYLALNWRDLFYKTSIILFGFSFLFFIILLKAKTTDDFYVDPALFSYGIFATAFILSRIISAMFYASSCKSLAVENNYFPNLYNRPYEPDVAFVIPCKNEEKNIEDSISKCYEVDYPQDKLEVIVVNDGSTDQTMSVLNNLKKIHPNLKVIDWPNQGKRWGMAAGFKVSKAEIIIQLDSDSYIDPKTFRELISPFNNPEVAAVCAYGEPKNADQNIVTKMQAAYYFMSFRILKAAESTFNTVFCASGCCSAYRKEAVMPVLYKWLSETFLGRPATWGDDRSLTCWLLKSGWKTIYNDKAKAFTVVPDTWKKLLKQQLRWKKSWIVNSVFTSRFIWKKQPFVSFFYYFPLVLISFLTPVMTFRVLLYTPITRGMMPFYHILIYHILGILLVTGIMAIYYRFLDKKDKYWPYLFLWSLFNLFFLSFMIVIAAIRIQDRGWGTR